MRDTGKGMRRLDRDRGTLLLGLALVGLGAAFLLLRVLNVDLGSVPWPLWITAVGVLIVVAALISRSGGGSPAVPGAMIMTIGLVMLVRQETRLWSSWAYSWALVAPGAVGLGLMLQGLTRRHSGLVRAGLRNLIAGLVIFLLLAALFELVFGIDGPRFTSAGRLLLPAALLLLGLLLVGRSLVRRRAG